MGLEWALATASQAAIAASGLLVAAGVVLVRLGRRDLHRRAMLTACAFAVVFVALYVASSTLFPPERYSGGMRRLFYSLLWSHTFLSLVNLPLAVATVYLAFKGRFDRHRRVAPFTAGVWMYVAASGWTIFLMN